jgi:uncharacterized membrane protein
MIVFTISRVLIWKFWYLVFYYGRLYIFTPSIEQPVKKGAINLLGENGYKLTFTAVVAILLVLIVYGWRHTTPVLVYTLPLFVKPVSLILMIVAFLLFATGKHPTRIKSFVRHPQLMSILHGL